MVRSTRTEYQPSDLINGAAPLMYVLIRFLKSFQAGGWKSTRMPLQYAEKIVASRSGMARAAAAAGRDAISEQAIADTDP
jgi:hypothetical protein